MPMHHASFHRGLIRLSYILVIVAALTAMLARGADVTWEFQPANPRVGDECQLILSSHAGLPVLAEYPAAAGVNWLRGETSNRMSSINGNRTYSMAYTFATTREGTIAFPEATVFVGNNKSATVQVTVGPLTVGAARTGAAGGDSSAFIKVLYGAVEQAPTTLYLDQELSLSIELYVRDDDPTQELSGNAFGRADYFFPNLELDNVSYRQQNDPRQNVDPRFVINQTKARINQHSYMVFNYLVKLRPQAIGPLVGTISHRVPFVNAADRRDPFGGFGLRGERTTIKNVSFKLPPIEVKPLPPAPADKGFDLGLVGDWKVSTTLDKTRVGLGEDVALTLRAEGFGNVDSLRVPTLDIRGFNVYPPEVTRTSGNPDVVQVRWVMVPRRPGSTLPDLSFQTFDTGNGEWRTQTFKSTLEVIDNGTATEAVATAVPATSTGADGVAGAAKGQANEHRDDVKPVAPGTSLLYLKVVAPSAPMAPGSVASGVALVLLLGGVVLGGGLWELARRRETAASDPVAQRRTAALRRRSTVAKRVTALAGDAGAMANLVRDAVAPLVRDLYGLPPGATLSEVAVAVATSEPELAEALRQAEASAYMPASAARVAPDRLSAIVARLTVWTLATLALPTLLVGGALAAPHASAAEPVDAQSTGRVAGSGTGDDAVSVLQAAQQAYDAGDFRTASKLYSQVLRQPGRTNDVALLYNLANAYAARDDLALALVYLEKARRLAPRDGAIRANLEFVRHRLNLPPDSTESTPAGALIAGRDYFLPEEWLALAALAFAVLAAGLGLNRLRRGHPWHPALLAPAAVLLVALAAWGTELGTTWAPGQYLVVSQHAALRPLPSETVAPESVGANGAATSHAGGAIGAARYVDAGLPLTVLEQRGIADPAKNEPAWVRVRVGEAEGWLRTDEIFPIW